MKDYPKDETFIWKDLIARSLLAVDKVKKLWRKDQHVPRMILSWPAEHLMTPSGKMVTDIVSFAIPEGMDTFTAAVQMAKETQAYGLLLIERRGEDMKIILESHHGTRCWTLPIRRHGDVLVLEKENASENTEGIGVLWRRNAGQS